MTSAKNAATRSPHKPKNTSPRAAAPTSSGQPDRQVWTPGGKSEAHGESLQIVVLPPISSTGGVVAKSVELCARVTPQLPTESNGAYQRYLAWVSSDADGGKRSLARVAEQFGVAERSLREQHDKYRWRERAASLLRHAIEGELSQGMAVQRRAAVAQVALAERLTSVIEAAVAQLETTEDGDALEAIGPALESIKALQRIQAAQRLASGQTTSNVGVHVFDKKAEKRDYSVMSTEDLEAYNAAEHLMAKLDVRYGWSARP